MLLCPSNNDSFLSRFAASPQEIFQILSREFPQADKGMIDNLCTQTNNVSIARWLLKNVALIKGIGEVPNALNQLKLFDQNKAKLKANGKDIDISKYNYQSLLDTIQGLQSLQKSKTEQKQSLPKELIGLITAVTTKAFQYVPQDRQQIEKKNIFEWFNWVYTTQLESGLRNAASWFKEMVPEETLKNILEDKTNYIQLITEFYIWKYSPDDGQPLSNLKYKNNKNLNNFANKTDIHTFLDNHLTQEQKQQRYSLDPQDMEGFDITQEGDLKAIKVTEWNDHFAEKLCKQANWCIRDKRAFEGYEIGPDNPVFLVSKGNQQLAMCGFKSGQIKDVNDNPIEADLALQLYPLLKVLANK